MPQGEAKPLGESERKQSDGWHYRTKDGWSQGEGYPSREAARRAKKEKSTISQKVVDSASVTEVRSEQVESNSAIDAAAQKQPQEKTMTLTLKNLSKNGKRAIYSGALQSINFTLGLFPNKTAPASIEVADGVFAVSKPAKVKLTKEERAALPKPTLAERIAKREAQLAKDKAQLAAASQM